MDDKYKKVVEANIAVHSKLAAVYEKTEPHFRPENIAIVEARIKSALAHTSGSSLLDLGCGTGFVITIAKPLVKRIVGVDATRAMLDRVDTTGSTKIELIEHDTGSVPIEAGTFDVVTAYSFLHHLYDLKPTLATASKALKKGGQMYADLDPNFYFWEAITKLDGTGAYDPIVQREIDAVAHKDDQMEAEYGIAPEVFNDAEYGKTAAGGFKEEVLRETLLEVGFSKVEFRYYWYLGQAFLVNDERHPRDKRLENAETTDSVLQRVMPLSRNLYKYIGFVATK